jgi:DinB superfamily
MKQEIALYERELCWLLEQMHHTVDGLTERQLHWYPAQAQANSGASIINHILACTRVYVLGFGCGQPVSRDRSTEFTPANASLSSCSAAFHQLADDIRTALASLQPEELDERLVPPQELWGEIEVAREITRREAFILSIRHAAIHLGELRLTSDLARQHT